MNLESWHQLAQGLASSRLSNVLQPLVWLLLIVGGFCLTMVRLEPAFAWPGFILFSGSLFYILIAYGYFARTSPDRLQNESFQMQSKRLHYKYALASKQGQYSDPNSLEQTAAPALAEGQSPEEGAV